MKIGIFSGSFNPIHIGHLILGSYIAEFTDIDEVWYLVSPHNPLKESIDLLDEDERLKMVEMALSDYPKLKASNFEFSLPRPSFTVNTLEKLQEAYSEHTFELIIGADNWCNFKNWKSPDEIISNFHIKVYPRLGHDISIPAKLRDRVEAVDTPIIEMSSTFIREGIEKNRNVKSFLPQGIFDYINRHNFYRL